MCLLDRHEKYRILVFPGKPVFSEFPVFFRPIFEQALPPTEEIGASEVVRELRLCEPNALASGLWKYFLQVSPFDFRHAQQGCRRGGGPE